MHVDFFKERFAEFRAADALAWRDAIVSYTWLGERVDQWQQRLASAGLSAGTVVTLEGDFSPNSVALLLALIDHGAIIVPLAKSTSAANREEFLATAEVECRIIVGSNDDAEFRRENRTAAHPLLAKLKEQKHPGLILFSSGSTGKSKAAVHDFLPILEKFKLRRQAYRTISFLMFDHIGGLNTLLYTLSNGGCLITLEDRSPRVVCEAIQRHRVQTLPTSPTFMNLLLVSEAYREYDLSSLELVTYGTEVMPESTLKKFHETFPSVRLLQTYGLSELGILRSKSKSSDSLWVKIGGEGFETRIVDGLLEIKAASAMLGYLNAPSPFTDDGWFKTGDAVEVDGEYMRILGRRSEIINVGGEKVYPAEVESAIQTMDGVEDVVVGSEPHALLGHIVTAHVKLSTPETLEQFRLRMRQHCAKTLTRFKIPQKVFLATGASHGERFKKIRKDKLT
jgi:long-chain acyl-CoA synthetase